MSRPIVAALLAVPVLGGCAVMSLFAPRAEGVDVAEVFSSTQCGTQTDAAQLRWLPDTSAVRALGLGVDESQLFAPGPYALVEMGLRASGGYRLAVSRRAQRQGNTLRLYATFISPPPGTMQTMALTSPCVLVALPPEPVKRLELIDESGAVRAEAEAPA